MTSAFRKVLPALAAAAVVAGCGSNVQLDPPTVPEPLVEAIPIHVVVRMPDEFQSFVHTEDIIGSEEWSIDLGRSNAIFFEELFGHLFDEVTTIGPQDDESQYDFDALIEPSIDAFEFSVPSQSKTEAFAVWIRYRLKVFDRNGQMIGDWPVSAYGKSLTTTMGGSDALQRAAVLAMRDAAALMIFRFDPEEFVRALSLESPPAPADGEVRSESSDTTASISGGAGDNDDE